MKTKYILFVAVAAIAAAACSKIEEQPAIEPTVPMEFSTVLTKTQLSTGNSVVWENDDEISVFDGEANREFTMKGTPSGSSATFSGEAASVSAYYAVYPYAASNSFSGGKITATVPATQIIQAGSFESGASVAAAYTEGSSLAFTNQTALIKFRLGAEMIGVTEVVFSGNNGEKVAGKMEMTWNATDSKFDVEAATTAFTSVTLSATSGSFETETDYYLAFIPQTFSGGVSITFTRNGNTFVKSSNTPLETHPGKIYALIGETTLAASLSFEKDTYSFNYGDDTEISFTAKNVASIAATTVPSGWTVTPDLANNKIRVEAPDSPDGNYPPSTLTLTVTASGATTTKDLTLRLFGIGNLEEALAFREAHGATGTLTAEQVAALNTSCAPYLNADGEVALNADLTLARNTMYTAIPAYFIHHLYLPLNGNGHTITADYKSNQACLGLFQYLHENVKNLNIAGTFEIEYRGIANLASLAMWVGEDGLVIDNVNSSATLIYNSDNGGLVGGIVTKVASNCGATVKNCDFSGKINIFNGVDKAGGIIAYGTADTACKMVTIDNCKFTNAAEINYASTTHQNSRIGGIMGSQERNGTIKNCTSSGNININLYGTTMVSNNSRGVGGILGRCNAYNASYTMETYLKDNTFDGTITVVNGPGEDSSYYGRILGTDLRSASQASFGTDSGNSDDAVGTIILDGSTAGALSFNDPTSVSFNYGETKVFNVTVTGSVTNVSSFGLPAGWTVNCSEWASGTVSVTAPLRDAIKANTAAGIGNIVLNATLSNSSVVPSDNVKSVRLYGINSSEEWAAFKTAYGSSSSSYSAGTSYDTRLTNCAAYFVNEEITLNSNITVSGTNYIIHHLEHSLNGNGRTITMTISGSAWPIGFCQHLKGTNPITIHDVNLAGSLTWTWNVTAQGNSASNKKAYAGVFVAWNNASTVTFERVVNSVNFTWNSPAETGTLQALCSVGGFVGTSDSGITMTFNDCDVKGSFTKNCRSFATGGYVGWNGGTSKLYFNNSVFSGSISCTSTQDKTVMETANYGFLGGFVGSSDAQANAVISFKACTSSGTITLDDGARAVGGFVGKLSAPTTFADDDSGNHCTFSGKINFTETQAVNGNRDIIGGFVGRHTANSLSMTNCVGTSGSQINFTGAAYTGIDKLIGQDSASSSTTKTDNTSDTVITIVNL